MSAQGNPFCRRTTGMSFLIGGLSLALMACEDSRAPDLPHLASVPGSTLPTLVERPIRIRVDDQPDMGFFGLAVSDIGSIVYVASAKDAPFIRVIDSTGQRRSAFGRSGEGPGEMGTPSRIAWHDNNILITSRMGVVARFDVSGKLLDEYRLDAGGVSVALTEDGLYVARMTRSIGEPRLAIYKESFSADRTELLVPPDDSMIRAHMAGKSADGSHLLPFAAGRWGYAWGDGFGYDIRVHLADGSPIKVLRRTMEPRNRGPRELALEREALDRMRSFRGPDGKRIDERQIEERKAAAADAVVPHFERGSLFLDGRQRLWVFGMADDSTFADIFADTTFLGRLMIPCFNRYGWRDLSGSWLVMGCEGDGGVPATLKLFRIID